MKRLIPLILILNSSVYAKDVVETETVKTVPVDPEVVESCEVEGQSMAFKGKDLEAYIEECIADFADTDLVITPTS